MNQETLESLAATRDLAKYHLEFVLWRLEELAHDKQNTSSETPPQDTRA